MTTIAYRNGVLAADTCVSVGDSHNGRIVKIARRDDGSLAGAAGDAAYNAAFLRWFSEHEQGAPPEAMSSRDYNTFDRGVIFRPDGTIEVFEPRGSHTLAAKYYALGSGRPEALGAMFAGADALTAVRAAMAHDAHTGGEVLAVSRHGSVGGE